jgi:hypothetical protein
MTLMENILYWNILDYKFQIMKGRWNFAIIRLKIKFDYLDQVVLNLINPIDGISCWKIDGLN